MLVASILVIFPFCMAFAAVSDLMSMTIANRVSLILVAAFVAIAPLTGMAWQEYGMHFAAMAAVLSVTFVLFALGGMGGGDAKLLAATALWMGFDPALAVYLVASAFFGGMLTLLIIMYRSSPMADITVANTLLRHIADRDVGIPYGVALGVGGLFAYPQSPLMLWAFERLATAG